MGVFDAVTKFQHKAEIRESKDEMLVGELVRAMARMSAEADQFQATGDFQRVRFRITDDVLSYVHLVLDRKTGSGVISGAVAGSRATLTVVGEVKNYLSDPDDLVAMWRTDVQNIFKLGFSGDVKVNHELNSVLGRTTDIINIDDYVLRGEAGLQPLLGLLQDRIGRVREAVRPYKKPTR
jgi:hypothetical protein